MAHASGSMPFIKHEPDERANDPNLYMVTPQSYGTAQQFGHHYNSHQSTDNIDPSALSMHNGNFGVQYPFGSQQNLSSSYNLGNSIFNDDELLESLDMTGQQDQLDFTQNYQQNNNAKSQFQGQRPTGISMSHQGQMTHVYSNTPDGPPIQSPFLGRFDYSQFRPMNSIPNNMSSHNGETFGAVKRASINRRSSDQRSPMTPKTPTMNALQLGTPESTNLSSQPIRATSLQTKHHKTLSNGTPGSYDSFGDSPLSSPGHLSHHTGISEVLTSGKHASSLPHKVGNGHHPSGPPSYESQERKKAKRRESHNAVERRRRDNINERIQDLSHLVPQHRLDDDKVKKQLQNNPPLSPTGCGTSMSPPNPANAATSLLAGASGRRAASTAGNITIGLPIEEKEKGPNKGDILNGSVSWTRDLMWALYRKYQQEDELAQYLSQLGGSWPFEVSEDERRMRSEVMDAMDQNDPSTFAYTRGHGSGLRVPRHTNIAGEPMQNSSAMSPVSNFEVSPPFHSGDNGTNSGNGAVGHAQYWTSAGHAGISLKEEDEFMEM